MAQLTAGRRLAPPLAPILPNVEVPAEPTPAPTPTPSLPSFEEEAAIDAAVVETPRELAVGFDIGGTGVKAALVNLATGELVSQRARVRTPIPSVPTAVADAMNRFALPFAVATSAMRSRVGDQVGLDSMLPPKPKVAALNRAGFASGVGATYTRGAPLTSLTYASNAPPAANAG